MNFEVLGALFVLIVAPIVTYVLKGYDWAKDLGVPLNGAIAVLLFLAAWAALGADVETLWGTIQAALTVAFGGSAFVALRRRLQQSGTQQ